MKKPLAAVASLALACTLGIAAQAPAAAAPYCGITWGSTVETKAPYSSAQVTDVRSGRHACFDRLVIDLKGKVKGYDVRHSHVYTEGEGKFVPLAGATDLRIIVKAPAYNSRGQATYDPRNPSHVADVDGYRTFRQVAYAGSFEGQTTFGLGVRALLPFRAFIVDGPGTGSRLVIDVAHRW